VARALLPRTATLKIGLGEKKLNERKPMKATKDDKVVVTPHFQVYRAVSAASSTV
jgi:hypothetical protein